MSSSNSILKNSTIPTSKIIGIQFSMLSNEEKHKSSVANIYVRDMYENNKPVINSLTDIRMGVQEPGLICPTDNLDNVNTPGYHGHIELARPVFYLHYLKDIMKWLNCVCYKCSKLLISKTKYNSLLKLPNQQRWKHVSKLCKLIKRCGEDTEDGCGCLQPSSIKKEGFSTIIAEWSTKSSEKNDELSKTMTIKLTAEIVHKIFKRITDDDIDFAGFSKIFSRPEWMICYTYLIPPPAIRPSVKQDSQQRSEDDLTHILLQILKTNNTLNEKIQVNAPSNIIDDWTSVLQYYVGGFIDNNMKGVSAIANRSGRPLKSIRERLNAKNGRMRGNLMAKRVDFSARSVITGEPNLSIIELGVPLQIAKNITKPITVNERNRSFLIQLIKNGPDIYPGAKSIKRKNDSRPITLRYMERESIVLYNGDIVNRHLMNGDFVLFNRQPTLHRMSMQGLRVRVMMKGNTFRFNVGIAKPFNADYDGDEMNMHVPQNEMAEIELEKLAGVPYQIISPANNAPIIGPVQDNLLGAYLFTDESISFSPKHAMNLLMKYQQLNMTNLDELIKKNHKITNFDILSQITPPISLKYKTKGFNNDIDNMKTSNNVLEIHNGTYLRGRMDKGVLGGGSKSLIQRITNDYSNMQCVHYIDNLQNIITEFMKLHSFSVGISDLISNKKTNDDIIKIINDKRTEVKDIIDQVMLGTFINNTGRTNKEEFELQVNGILGKASGEAGKIAIENLDKNNKFVTLVKAGSKGNENNIAFMTSCLGQQNVEGKRIPDGFNGRTLPHFSKYDESPISRGFIVNSYVTGLTASDLFFHAMAGRVGLIDTAVKSVIWETPIILIENGEIQYTEIGRWIDNKLDFNTPSNSNQIQYFTERNMELLSTESQGIYIPTTDADGNVTWGEIIAVTRHDPGTELYEIKTEGGRTVTVTESKSLLVWDKILQQFHEKPTPEIKIGDFVPVSLEVPGITNDNKLFTGDNILYIHAFLAKIEYTTNTIVLHTWYENALCYVNMILNMHKITGIVDMKNVKITLGGKYGQEFAKIYKNASIENDSISLNEINQLSDIQWDVTDPLFDFQEKNNVVLDKITEINIIGVEKHPKVYDLTIPSTFNFGLANGLQVRDTSSTGYIQRRLVKGLEDGMVRYDHTVRTNKGHIMQFRYGDDSIDTIRVESQQLPLLGMSIQDIYNHYYFPDILEKGINKTLSAIFVKQAFTLYKKQKTEMLDFCQKYTDTSIKYRNDIIKHVFNYTDENTVNCPVAFSYIINNIQGQLNMNQYSLVDITPIEVFQLLEKTMNELEQIHTASPTHLFKAMYYFYLSPKDLLLIKRFNRASIQLLLDTIKLTYKQAIVAPGEMVGPVAAQSIGEISTQMTLNTFHHIGVASKANVTRGVPRIEEILALSEKIKNPSLTICLKEEDQTKKEIAQDIMYQLEHTTLEEFVKNIEICFDPDDLNVLMETDKELIAQYKEFENMVNECANASFTSSSINNKSKWILRMEMDAQSMLEKNITMDDIHFTLNNIYSDQISCVYSDFNADKLIFRIRMNEIIKQNSSKTSTNKKPLDQSDQIYILKNFQYNLLKNVVIRGTKNIKKVTLRKIKNKLIEKNGAFVQQDQWVLDTLGTNLLEILSLDYIDKYKTTSNDIMEVYNVLGIEATRHVIYNELCEVIKFDGTYINYHHYSVLCDRMCYTHHPISIFRHGINNDDIGPIAKASFEETPEMFMNAAKHGELDTMTGVSANIMCGQEGMYGTSSFEVILNMMEMSKLKSTEEKIINKEKEIDDFFKGEKEITTGDVCSMDNLAIQNNVINIQSLELGKENEDYVLF